MIKLSGTSPLKMHLRYDLRTAGMDCHINKHPQKMMKELGIAYQHLTPPTGK